ncbi:MAG: DUF1957 domain-containing protein [Chitinivibrionales bacterium]|nr:DUF1957 domain-containing protein [Chitinivibrionales bacterium]MBD3395229.1 DUF1957 domain-containing protein [Chitinivibrionales bacterium]
MNIDLASAKGYLALVLHAHLPYVRHPEREHFMEENWLFEAITETYIPLLTILQNLTNDRVPFRLTMSMTPPLCSMLADPLLQRRYARHIGLLIELAEKETVRTRNDPAFAQTAQMYLDRFRVCRRMFVDICNYDLVAAFRRLQDAGSLEIIACAATHGYLPNMQANPTAVRAQVHTGVESYRSFFGRRPRGIWLPECGYYPGLEEILEEERIRYFFTDTHGILYADPRPKYGIFAPVFCGNTGVAAFARDVESSKSVWSSKEGYPGDRDYRDFYRDIGFDLDMDYIRPYIDPAGIPMHTGIKYYRITGKTKHKQPYDYRKALRRASVHAGNFMFNREKQVEYLASNMDRPPIIIAPYDAELFGHWWYEGPYWINHLMRKMAFEQNTVRLVTCAEYLDAHPLNQVCTPSFSSWGDKGYSEVWLAGGNDWIYRHLHRLEEKMCDAARRFAGARGLRARVLNQMARELLLAQASDWAFIMSTGTNVDYAVRRTKEHVAAFLRLHRELLKGSPDEAFVSLCESHDNIFPNIDFHMYASSADS